MLMVDVKKLEEKIRRSYSLLEDSKVCDYCKKIVESYDERLSQNINEWIHDKAISDVYFGKYCVNMIMAIQQNNDFLYAIDALNQFLSDEQKGIKMIWRGKA